MEDSREAEAEGSGAIVNCAVLTFEPSTRMSECASVGSAGNGTGPGVPGGGAPQPVPAGGCAPSQDPKSMQELTHYVQTLLQNMQDKFQTMSDQIITRIDEMGNRIDDLEKNIADLMTQAGVEGSEK